MPEVTGRFMWITPGRVFYGGLLGAPSVRRLGAWTLYFSRVEPLRLALHEAKETQPRWQEGHIALVPPYEPHRVSCAARRLPDVLLEPETLDVARCDSPVSRALRGGGGILDVQRPEVAELLDRLCAADDELAARADPLAADDDAFDRLVFGAPLARPALDPRIQRALALLEQAGADSMTGQVLAQAVGLSFSRFLHLFKDSVGVPLRTFRSWKRARSWLKYVTQETRLTDIAYTTGYPDSAHFSRSVRQVFGLQPKDVMAGCRRLALHGKPGRVG